MEYGFFYIVQSYMHGTYHIRYDNKCERGDNVATLQ